MKSLHQTLPAALLAILATSPWMSLASQADEAETWTKAGFANPVVKTADVSKLDFGTPRFSPALGLDVTSVILRQAGWTEEEVIGRYASAAKTLGQCGIKLTGLKVVTVDPPQGMLKFDGPVHIEPDQLDDPNKKEAIVARMLPMKNRPVVFYVKTIAIDQAYANLAESEPESNQNSPVIDTVWISRPATSTSYSSRFSLEAHELSHVLGKISHLYLPHLPGPLKNLMAADPQKISFDLNDKQCGKLRASPLLKAL